MLLWASEVAYGEGITGLVKVAGPAAGLTRLAGVRLDDLAGTDDCAHIGLRWVAIAADGKLFTALDADLMLVPAGDQITALILAGAYRPQPGLTCAGLDPAIVVAVPRQQSAASWPGWHCARPPCGHGKACQS